MITAIITVYIVSAYLMWRFTKISHSKGGRYERSTPDSEDLLLTFLPILNTLFAIIGWILFFPRKRVKKERNYSKFFAINDNRSLFQRIQYGTKNRIQRNRPKHEV